MLQIRYYFAALLINSYATIESKLVNLSLAKCEVENYYESGAYDVEAHKIVDKAIKYFAKIAYPANKTVIFDIDDTALSTFDVAKSVHYGHVKCITLESERGARLPAVPAGKRLYDFLIQRGFKIVFLTGRTEREYDATVKNLVTQGYTKFEALLMRRPPEYDLTAQSYKFERRKELVAQGAFIIGTVGDQWSDLCGGYAGYQVKLPNYLYELA